MCCLLNDDNFILFPLQVIETICARYTPCFSCLHHQRNILILPVVSILLLSQIRGATKRSHMVASSWLTVHPWCADYWVSGGFAQCSNWWSCRRATASAEVACRSVLSCWPKLHFQSVKKRSRKGNLWEFSWNFQVPMERLFGHVFRV